MADIDRAARKAQAQMQRMARQLTLEEAMHTLQATIAGQYAVVAAAQNQFCLQRADEICSDPMLRYLALVESFRLHPLKTVTVFDAVSKNGRVADLIALEDLLRKAAECMADEEWHQKNGVRITA